MSLVVVRPHGRWDAAAALATLARHAVPGAHRTDAERGLHTQVVTLEGRAFLLDLRLTARGVSARVRAGPTPPELAAVLRWWFDLDADTAAIDRHLSAEPLLAEQVRRRPGIRITRIPDAREAVLGTILGQQVSLARARTFTSRLLAAYGDVVAAGLRAFPEPERVAGVRHEQLREVIGLTRARARTLHAAAALMAEHPPADHGQPGVSPAHRARLSELPGIGPWTLSYLRLRADHQADVVPAGDAVLRRSLGGISVREVEARARAWSPYRSYATVRLWATAVG